MNSTIVRTLRLLSPAIALLAPGLAARGLEYLFLTPRSRALTATQACWIESATGDRLAYDGARSIPLYTWGTEGPVVLLVHGWSGRAGQLAGFADRLVAKGFRVVAFDAPGHGEATPSQSSLPEVAEVVERVAAEVGPLHGVVAHSMGAAATTIAMARGLRVQRAVYLAPPEDAPAYLYRLARWLGVGDTVADRVRARIEARYRLPFDAATGAPLAAQLDVPLLVFHDRQDREVPFDDAERLVAAWPGARLSPTDGLGHNRILQDQAVLRDAVAFLTAPDQERRSA